MARKQMKNLGGPVGFLHASTGGRTDNLPMDVKSGSYVIPADIVSALGEGNSLAGKEVLDEMFGAGSEDVDNETETKDGVPIIAAAGEYLIPPAAVAKIGDGDMEMGHETLDQFVRDVREKTVQTLSTLPGPAND